jgi:3-oxoacyl-[acyl-carrier-protein] synthase II
MVERPVRLAISNSFGFGGHNVCLAVKRYDG